MQRNHAWNVAANYLILYYRFDPPEGKSYRVGLKVGQTLRRQSGFAVKILGQLATFGPTQ
jgi:hypothetical protein